MSLASLVLYVFAGCAAGSDVEALQAGVDAAIASKDFVGGVAQADEALKLPEVAADPARAWRFQSARVNALAAAGKGADVLATLGLLKGTYAAQITASLYLSLADKLRGAGDGVGYANLLDAGLKKFPEEKAFQAKIEEMKSSADSAAVEQLKALGYL